MNDVTLEYYNNNVHDFIENTRNIALQTIQDRYLKYLRHGSRILDFGCGSGRDIKYFIEQGFIVDGIDGSEELCKLASDFTGIEVRQMLFHELDYRDVYDGIWACASILHLSYEELKKVLVKIAIALKENGILYTSFKYGEYEGLRDGRYFTDMTENKFQILLSEIGIFDRKEMWITSDVRPGRNEEKWLNLILIRNFRNQK